MFDQTSQVFVHFQFTLIHGPSIPGSYALLLFYSIELYFYHQTHPRLGVVSTSTQPLYSFRSCFCTLLQQHIGHLLTWGVHLSMSYLFAFSYFSWSSKGKNPEVACHSLLQWTTFCRTFFTMTHPSQVVPHSLAHSFTELCKVVVHVIVCLVFRDCGFHSICLLMDEDNRLVQV